MKNTHSLETATLLIYCADQKGIIATVTEFIHKNDGNILYLDQHVDHNEKVFFMRAQWDLTDFQIPRNKIGDYFQTLIGEKFKMRWKLYFDNQKQKMALFVSNLSHCLYDILSRQQSGEWNVEIPLIISNHDSLRSVAQQFNIDYYHLPITAENKLEQEDTQIALLKQYAIDFVVLARYMQVVSNKLISFMPHNIINIHHSFLPAFAGSNPYKQAFERGHDPACVTHSERKSSA